MARVILENVRVDFAIYGAQQRSLRTAIVQRATGGLIHREGHNKERIVVRALSNVSLQLEEGDRLGLIGHNGSGKSTLLKVIAGIYEPIVGTRMVEGRVTPLFDMMPGLDPEDNGYENILTSGMLLGMSREEVESKIPQIEEFCELGEYLSLPVRTYSAGMTARLGFALVTALEPSILLIDEGFGAGDLRFTESARERMDAFIGRSRIMVFASHSEELIKSMCNKAALMKEGRIIAAGPVEEMVDQYYLMVHGPKEKMIHGPKEQEEHVPATSTDAMPPISCKPDVDLALHPHEGKQKYAEFTRLKLLNAQGQPSTTFVMGKPLIAQIEFRCKRRLLNGEVGLKISSRHGTAIHYVTSSWEGPPLDLESGSQTFVVTLPQVILFPGTYVIALWVLSLDEGIISDSRVQNVTGFLVAKGDVTGPLTRIDEYASSGSEVYVPSEWKQLDTALPAIEAF